MNSTPNVLSESPKARSSFASAEWESRLMRARKVKVILDEFTPFSEANVLDIGTGSGIMASYWAQNCRSLTSVDVEDQREQKEGYTFQLIESEQLPFSDESFPIIISNQVLEHVWNPDRHLKEIARVLTKEGIAYLSTPNRFTLIEPHYRLPLLAWFGNRIAEQYLQRMKKKHWDVRLFSYWALRRKLSTHFHAQDVIPMVMSDPLKFHQTTRTKKANVLQKLPGFVWQCDLNPLLPSFMLVLRKKSM